MTEPSAMDHGQMPRSSEPTDFYLSRTTFSGTLATACMESPTLMQARDSLSDIIRFSTKPFTLTELRVTAALVEREQSRFITTVMSEPTVTGSSARCEAASSYSMTTSSLAIGQG